MRSGQRNVLNPITFITTTGYEETNSIMNEELEYIRKLLKGEVKNDKYFALVYYAEEEHLWDDIGLYQANPLRIEDNYNEIRENREKAKDVESLQGDYLTKSMNVMQETNLDGKYLEYSLWRECESKEEISIEGREIVVSVDLSVSNDLTAVGWMFKDDYIYCGSHGFLPNLTIKNTNRREHIDYKYMESKGYCSTRKDVVNSVDYDEVYKYIHDLEDVYGAKIKLIIFDPREALELQSKFEGEGYDILSLQQGYSTLSLATKEFRRFVYEHKLLYQKNELLDWNVSCAICHVGNHGDEMIGKTSKDKNKTRIDMLAVLIFCMTQFAEEEEDYSNYDPFASCKNSGWNN